MIVTTALAKGAVSMSKKADDCQKLELDPEFWSNRHPLHR